MDLPSPHRQVIDRVVYLLDRSLADAQKIRAFRKAGAVLDRLGPGEVEKLATANRLIDLDGIGSSTNAVVLGAYGCGPTTYLDELETSTEVPLGPGRELRAALKGDCHSHSEWSDGAEALRTMALAARAIGHEYLVATDHSARLTVAHGLGPERLAEQLDEIARLNEELAPFRILTGMEVDILVDGSLDLPDEWLARLDVVVASVHYQIHQDADAMTKRLVKAVANPNVDILGHCTNRKLAIKPHDKTRKPSSFDADYVFAACARFDTAVEINCRMRRQDPPEDLLALAIDWGCDVSIDSDAHAPGQLEWVNYGCDKAAIAGIAAERILNTRPAEELAA